MAGASAIRAGRAFIEFFGDATKLEGTMGAIQGQLKTWGKKVGLLGAAVSAGGAAIEAPMLAAAKVFASTSHEATRLSEQTGMSAESIMTLGGAAKRSGVEMDDVATGVKKMQKSIFDAAMGSESAQMALRHLGLSVGQLLNMRPEDQFRLIAERLSMIKNPAVQTGVAMEIMGKSAATLLPMMKHLRELEERGKRSGPGITNEDIAMGHELELSFMDLTSAIKKFTLQIGAAVGPTVKRVVDTIVSVIASANQWIKDNRELVDTIFKISAAVMAAGAVIGALGTAMVTLATIMGVVGAVLSTIIAAVTFLISPIGLAIAAVVGLTIAFFKFTETGQAALAFITEAFTAFKDDAIEAFNGVRDALASGDIALALKVLGTFLTLQWAKIVAFFKTQWANFLNWMVPPTIELAKKISDIFIGMMVAVTDTIMNGLQQLNELLGGKLIDRTLLTGLRAGLPFLGIALKGAAAKALDDLGGNITGGADDAAAAALDNVDEARTNFKNAVATAKKNRKEFKAGPGGVPQLPFGVGDFGGLKSAVSGTFSAVEAAGLAGTGTLQKVADNTTDMRNTLHQINNKQPALGVV